MKNSIQNTLFSDFHSDSIGGVFTSHTLNLSIIRCAFHRCTSTISAACFLFTKGTISISKTCFYYSAVLTQKGNVYGNAFHI